MSSSFFLRRDPPTDAAAVIAALDRPGLRWADGELDELSGPWPAGVVLLWVPGASTRGVEITCADGRIGVRVLAMSSPDDYDLAFRLIEVLGGDGAVEPEAGAPLPAATVRTRFDRVWMTTNMAAGAAGVAAALARGKRVTVSGPRTSVRIDPVVPFDAAAFLTTMQAAQAAAVEVVAAHRDDDDDDRSAWQELEDGELLTGEQEHQEALIARDTRLAPLARSHRSGPRPGRLLWLVMLALALLPALMIRVATWPFRRRLRQRRAERRGERTRRERETCRDEVVRETARLAIVPDDGEARRRRADRLRRLGHRAAAERDLAECLHQLPDAAASRGALLLEHAAVLRDLRCPNLAAAAETAAATTTVPPRPRSNISVAVDDATVTIRTIAGLADD